MTTPHCTAKCHYCHNEGQTKKMSKLLLTGEWVEKLLDMLETLGYVPEEIVLSGGEPTLSPHIVGIASVIKRRGIYLSMNSHGGHWNLLEPVLPYLDEVKYSIDCLDASKYESIKGLKLPTVLANLMKTRDSVPLTKINCPFTDLTNAREMIEFSERTRVPVKFMEILGMHDGNFIDPGLRIDSLHNLLNTLNYMPSGDPVRNIWHKRGNPLQYVITMRPLCIRAASTGDRETARYICRTQNDMYIDGYCEIKSCVYKTCGLPIWKEINASDLPALQEAMETFVTSIGSGPCLNSITSKRSQICNRTNSNAIFV